MAIAITLAASPRLSMAKKAPPYPKKFSVGAHRVLTPKAGVLPNATMRNTPDHFVMGQLFPGDKFYILDQDDAFNRLGEKPYASTRCRKCLIACRLTDSQKCRNEIKENDCKGCTIQYAYGYAVGKYFEGCGWIHTGYLSRFNKENSRVKKLSPADRKKPQKVIKALFPSKKLKRSYLNALKCKKSKYFNYSSLASRRTPINEFCRTDLPPSPTGDLFCGCAKKALVCNAPVKAGHSNVKVTPNIPWTGGAYAKHFNHKNGLQTGEWVTTVNPPDILEVRYVAKTSGTEYALVRLGQIPTPRRKTVWGFVPTGDIDLSSCIARGVLSTRSDGQWSNGPCDKNKTCGGKCIPPKKEKKAGSSGAPSCPVSPPPSSCAANSAAAALMSFAVASQDVEFCSPDGTCPEGGYCDKDGICQSCQDDNCIQSSEDAECIDGDPECTICEGAECAPLLGTCTASRELRGPVPFSGTVDCDGRIIGGDTAVHGSVDFVSVPGDTDVVEGVIDLRGAAPLHVYSIAVWEAGICGDPTLADTGQTIETDEAGDGLEEFAVPLPWAPFGAGALGDGQGTEAAVVVLVDSQTGERFSTDGAVPLGACVSTCKPKTEVVADNGFEAASLPTYPGPPLPVCVGQWCTHSSNGTASLVSSPVHAGATALQVDTRTETYGRFIYQDLSGTSSCFRWSFFVYRGEGTNRAELITDWDRGPGYGVAVSNFEFSDSGFLYSGWGVVTQFPTVLSPGVWHEVVVQAEGDTGRQFILIDGELVGQIQSPLAPPYRAPTVAILGDTAGMAQHGLYTYDDVSLLTAGGVGFQNATATFSQSTFGGFPVSEAIDGVVDSVSGWAIDEAIVDQTAVFETAFDIGGPQGVELTLTLSQAFEFPPYHTIGRFRLSVTADDRSSFADGLASGGDVSANWEVLSPSTVTSQAGATMTVLGDDSILASGVSPPVDVYTVTATTLLQNISGVRLEVMEDTSLPFNGPGRQPTNGNFTLTELQMSQRPLN